MSKRRYKSSKINSVDEASVYGAVRGQRVVFGVDIAKDVCFGRLLTEHREVVVTVRWHQLRETRVLLDFLKSLPARTVEVALESSGTYGDAFVYQLGRVGICAYLVSGKRCHDAAEVYDGVPSMHDAKAADILARLHLEGASVLWPSRSEQMRKLCASLALMDLHAEQYRRLCNILEGQMARHWPELSSVLKLDSATVLALLKQYGDAAAVAAAPDEARALMRRVGGLHLKEAKVQQVIETARQTLGVPPIAAERQTIKELATEAQRSRCAAQEARKQVRARGRGHDAIARMAPQLGEVTAAVIVVKTGEPGEFGSASAYVKAMGLNLKERSSGKHKGQLKITKRGPALVRQYLYLATLRLVQRRGDPLMRAWYLRKVKRDGGRVKHKAVVALMRKLAAALYHVGRGADFDSSKLFDTRRLGRTIDQPAAE